MKIFLIICAVLLFTAFLLLFIPVRVVVKFSDFYKNTSYKLCVKVGFVKIIDLPSKKQRKKEARKKEKKRPHSEPEKKSVKAAIDNALDLCKFIGGDIKGILSYTAKKAVKIEKLHFVMYYGTGDAASTGILYGAVAGVIYGMLGLLVHNHKTKDSLLSVTPDFNNALLNANGECILKLQNVHIIIIAVKLIKLIIKVKKRKERD